MASQGPVLIYPSFEMNLVKDPPRGSVYIRVSEDGSRLFNKVNHFSVTKVFSSFIYVKSMKSADVQVSPPSTRQHQGLCASAAISRNKKIGKRCTMHGNAIIKSRYLLKCVG